MEAKAKGIIKHVPNALTIGRLVMTVVLLGMILYAPRLENSKPAGYLLGVFILFVITGLTDIVDGFVARRFNATSKFGRIADPLADKFLVCGAFVCFAIVGRPEFEHFNLSPLVCHLLRWGAIVSIAAREIWVTVVRHIAESRGIAFGRSGPEN